MTLSVTNDLHFAKPKDQPARQTSDRVIKPLFFTCLVHTSLLDFPPKTSALLYMSHTQTPGRSQSTTCL